MSWMLAVLGIVGGLHASAVPSTRPQSTLGGVDTLSAMEILSPEGVPAVAGSQGPRHPAEIVQLSTTSYCTSGTMADGAQTHFGAVAMNGVPFGTQVELLGGEFAGDVFTVEDRIGWGSQLDVFQISCPAAWQYGRELVSVSIGA